MGDPKQIAILAALYPPFAERVMLLLAKLQSVKMAVRITEGCRPFSRSHALSLALAKEAAAPAGLSFHNYGIACDFCFLGRDPYLKKQKSLQSNRAWAEFGKQVETIGLKWGGRFPSVDSDHAELNIRAGASELFAVYRSGKMTAVWTLLDQLLGIPAKATWAQVTPFDPEKGVTS